VNRNRRVPQTKRLPVKPTVSQVKAAQPTVRVQGFDVGSEPTIEFSPGAGIALESLRATGRVKVTVDAADLLALAQSAQDDASLALDSYRELVVDDNVTSPPSTVYLDDGTDWVYDDPHY